MYIINKNTLYMYFDGVMTHVKEDDTEYDFTGNVTKKILDDSCIYYGSSYKGRLKGSKNLLDGKYKLPIIISEKSNILFFSLKGQKNNEVIWLNFNKIKNFNRNDLFVEVEFLNGFIQNFITSFTIFNNQMFKCSRLWLIYLTRC